MIPNRKTKNQPSKHYIATEEINKGKPWYIFEYKSLLVFFHGLSIFFFYFYFTIPLAAKQILAPSIFKYNFTLRIN